MPQVVELATIVDETSDCPYIEGRTARMPLQIPSGHVTPQQLDWLLASGYRRSGWFYYRTACPNCQACQPLRVDVSNFHWTKSLRRVLKRGDAELQLVIGNPTSDDARLRLFNSHRQQREMARDDGEATEGDYSSMFLSSFNTTWELSYWLDDRLAAVAISDIGEDSISAVYCFFDPGLDHLSLGTYSILKQIQIAEEENMRWVYLGMYVAENRHLKYKARYYPHERFEGGSWVRYEVEAK